jgi:putative oxidoreductase
LRQPAVTDTAIVLTLRNVTTGYPDMDQMLFKWQPTALSLFRFMTGLLLFQYGVAKILKIPVLPYFANPPPLIIMAGTLELVLGALLMLGLFTRIAAFILSGEMAFAYFMSHAPKGFYPISSGNGGELAIVYCFVFLYFFVVGAGVWSLDHVWASRSAGGFPAPRRA